MKTAKIYTNNSRAGENPGKLRILVAPLDWGLGHATRCIPVVYKLMDAGFEVWLAGEGYQAELLKLEFPQLPLIKLEGYRVQYGRSGWGLAWKMLFQSRKIFRAIQQEKAWLHRVKTEYGFDAVISDNRFGLSSRDLHCIFITHQLAIKTSFGNLLNKLIQKRNYRYMEQFDSCWVPDEEGANNLAGALSHPTRKPATKLRYVGALSRFSTRQIKEAPARVNIAERMRLLIILSGPEPQRSIFENKIIRDIAHFDGTATIVRGLPGLLNIIPSSNGIKFYNHLEANDLLNEIDQSEYIICRSGYSSIMDLVPLGKKIILVPTPGQPEQEYLARYMAEKNWGIRIEQQSFSLAHAMEKARAFNWHVRRSHQENLLDEAIKELILLLQNR